MDATRLRRGRTELMIVGGLLSSLVVNAALGDEPFNKNAEPQVRPGVCTEIDDVLECIPRSFVFEPCQRQEQCSWAGGTMECQQGRCQCRAGLRLASNRLCVLDELSDPVRPLIFTAMAVILLTYGVTVLNIYFDVRERRKLAALPAPTVIVNDPFSTKRFKQFNDKLDEALSSSLTDLSPSSRRTSRSARRRKRRRKRSRTCKAKHDGDRRRKRRRCCSRLSRRSSPGKSPKRRQRGGRSCDYGCSSRDSRIDGGGQAPRGTASTKRLDEEVWASQLTRQLIDRFIAACSSEGNAQADVAESLSNWLRRPEAELDQKVEELVEAALRAQVSAPVSDLPPSSDGAAADEGQSSGPEETFWDYVKDLSPPNSRSSLNYRRTPRAKHHSIRVPSGDEGGESQR